MDLPQFFTGLFYQQVGAEGFVLDLQLDEAEFEREQAEFFPHLEGRVLMHEVRVPARAQ
jgi:hypothetical protein